MKKRLFTTLCVMFSAIAAFASNNLLITGQLSNITNGVSTPVDGQEVFFSYTGNSGTETWTATTGINGYYEINLIGMSVIGPNRLVIVSTAGCNGAMHVDTVSNNQGTIDAATVNFVVCESTTSNTCNAMFEALPAPNVQGVYFLSNQSSGNLLSYTWSMNGVDFANSENAEITLDPGVYEVCLRVVSGTMDPIGCEDTYCTEILVGGDTVTCSTNFTYVQNEGSFVFEPYLNSGNGYTFLWNFGDGTTSDAFHPNHTFEPGSYEVCLTTTNPNGCVSSHCELVVIDGQVNTCEAAFTATVSNANPLRMIFLNNSLTSFNGITNYTWTLGDGNSVTTNNAEYTYAEAGYYTVCLSMNNDLCSDTLCMEVYVPGNEPQGFEIGGYVYLGESGLVADDAKVRLFAIDPLTGMAEQVAQTEVDTAGRYHFSSVASGSYYVKANLTEFSAYFGDYAPTYYGDVLYWENATVLEVSANEDGYSIHLLPAENNGGPGSVNGNVDEGPGRLMDPEDFSVASGPAANVHVLVTNLAGTAQRWAISDANGNFSIGNLDYGTYALFADVAGIIANPVEFTISPETPSATVMFVLGDILTSISGADADPILVYPNPAISQAQILVSGTESRTIRLVSLTGSVLMQQTLSGSALNQVVSLNLENFAAGTYFLLAHDAQGNTIATRRISVVK